MSFSITERELTADERGHLNSGTKLTSDDWEEVKHKIALWLLIGGSPLIVAGWITGDSFSSAVGRVLFGIVTLGTGYGSYFAWKKYRKMKAAATRLRDAINRNVVEVIDVTTEQFLEQDPYPNNGSVYYVEVDDSHLLLLHGKFLYDPRIFGQEDPDDFDFDSGIHNSDGEPLDWACFPTTKFTVHRLKGHGRVIKIELGGDSLFPAGRARWDVADLDGVPESLILDGTPDDIGQAVTHFRSTGQSG